MKTNIFPIAAAFLLTALFSCKKEVSIEKPGGLAGNFTAQINGTEWIASDSMEGASILQGFINITGISVDNKELSITLNDTVPGAYQLDQNSISVATFLYLDSSSSYAYSTNQGADTTQGGGLVTISSIDKVNKTISGTFSLKAYRDLDSKQVKITQGVFYKLPYTSSLPTASGKDTLTAKVDGGSWSAPSIGATVLNNQLIITGSQLNGNQTISLTMPANVTLNSYSLDYTTYTYFGIYLPTTQSYFASTSGTLLILENNATTTGRVRGTFQFTAADPTFLTATTHQISNGYFSVLVQ